MTGTAAELLRFRKQLLVSIRREIREILGPRPEPIRRYYHQYRLLFQRTRYTRIARGEVMKRVPSFPLVFLADFHTLPESQRSHVAVMKEILNSWHAPVIVMEMFASADQRHIDRFLDGQISEGQFLERIRYRQSWGFQWGNYRAILDLARSHRLKVLGMNLKEEASLTERDNHFAEVITAALGNAGGQPVCVMAGDLHCAPAHLPARIDARAGEHVRRIILYQNSETIYLRELERGGVETLEAVFLGSHRYCLFNTTPWEKMESYLNWLQNADSLISSELDAENEEVDYDNQVSLLLRNLAGMLKVRPIPFEDLIIHTVDAFPVLVDLIGVLHGAPFFQLLQDHQSFFIPGVDLLFLPAPNLNSAAAELSRALLCRHYDYTRGHPYEPGHFFRRVLYLAVGYFMTRLINPHYSIESRDEVQEKLSRHGDRRSKRKLTMMMRGNRLALGFWDAIVDPPKRQPYDSSEANRRDAEYGFRASKLLAQWTAHRMVGAFSQGRLDMETVRDLFPLPTDRESDALMSLRSIASR